MGVNEWQLNALRTFMKEQRDKGMELLIGCTGVGWLLYGISKIAEGGALFILVAIVCFVFAFFDWYANCSQEGRNRYAANIEYVINTAASFCGMDILLNDFAASRTIASPMTDSIRMGKQFLYLGSKGAIYHISEIQGAKVNVESAGENTDYDLRIFVKRDGKAFSTDYFIVARQERQFDIVADLITNWAADWHNAHPDYKKEKA